MALLDHIRSWYNAGTVHTVVREEVVTESKPVEQKVVGFRQPAMTEEERVEVHVEHHVAPDGMGLKRSMTLFLRRAFLLGLALSALAAFAYVIWTVLG